MSSETSTTTSPPSIILVTGGAGFVGSRLVRRLLERYENARIISVDTYLTGTERNHVDDPRVTYHAVSTVQLNAFWDERRLPAPEVTFHLGEYSRIVQSFEDFDQVWELNMLGTKEVVRFCHRQGSKLVYSGSSSKFGNDGRDEHLSPYAWMKAKNVEYIVNFSNWFGLDYVITYFYNVYGPGQIREGKYATVIGIFESLYERGKPLTVVSPGAQTRDFTHVDDIVEGVILCSERGHGDGYLLGTGQEHTVLEVARMFGGEFTMVPERRGERQRGRADTTKARALGWQPRHTLEDYVADFKRRTPAGGSRAPAGTRTSG